MAKPTRKIDPFTARRLERLIDDFRARTGQLPTLRDLGEAGFGEEMVDRAVRDGILEQLYVTLTNGTILKGYKFR
ncbi:MAG: hypothetical protein HY074_14040 [Deltaproteobacteria bacterium]|nr:hypothetical protein [Deltaproteobacteria bacterium]